ncbi:unnamed protein product [Haemonchus placei]|uniref:G_PROTEIN_RECEP_F1_2 domain-containing protein n=1 Tax=Haemonchus placei TaxID=6290 RepID=A0A0N4WYU2_HAEPC|nr:unnamed protein product [Haemonchus placei]
MTEDMRMRHISDYWMISTLVFFNIAGNFGNFNLIWLTVRRKELRSKAGILLAINAVFQSVCLVSTFINVTVILSGSRIARNVCYPLVMPFTIASSLQTPMALVIAIDLLLALISPLKYRQQDTLKYIVGLCAPGMIYALFIGFYGLIKMDNEMLDFCNVDFTDDILPFTTLLHWNTQILDLHMYDGRINLWETRRETFDKGKGLPPTVSALWLQSNVLLNSLVLLVYFGIFLVLRCNYNEMAYREHGRVVRRLAVIVIVFVFSWFMANLGEYQMTAFILPMLTAVSALAIDQYLSG